MPLQRTRIALPSRLTTEDVERYAADTHGESIELDPYDLSETGFGTEARLLGWLARHNLAQDRPALRVPRYGSPDRLPGKITSSLAFFVMSRMAGECLLDGREVSREIFGAQGRKLLEHDGRLIEPSARAYFYDHQFPGLPIVPELDRDPGGGGALRFRAALKRDLYELGLTDPLREADPPPPELLTPVREFVGEALNNARQHATTTMEGASIKGLAFVGLRSFFYRDAAGDYPGADGAVAEYLEALSLRLETDPLQLRFAEFTVADSGIGIARHYARRRNATFESYEEETTVLQDAFHMSDTAPQGSWIGVGLFKMLRAARNVNGLLTLRTGRVEAVRHYLGERKEDPLLIEPNPRPRALLGGTAVSLLVPWVDLDAPTLPFIDG